MVGETGLYQTADEYLRALIRRDMAVGDDISALREDIQAGYQDIKAGRYFKSSGNFFKDLELYEQKQEVWG
ncbi:MAG: ribbon-helix-helix domain-containing protein [Rhodospirillaceae bacterium]